MNPSDSNSIIGDTLRCFNKNFNSSNYKFLSVNYGCQDDIAIIRKFCINGVYIIILRNYNFIDRVFILMLAYQDKSMSLDEFNRMLESLLDASSVDIIVRDLSCDLSKLALNKLLDHTIEFIQVIYETTCISTSQIGPDYIKSALLEGFQTKAITQKMYLYNHDAVRIDFWKNEGDFIIRK